MYMHVTATATLTADGLARLGLPADPDNVAAVVRHALVRAFPSDVWDQVADLTVEAHARAGDVTILAGEPEYFDTVALAGNEPAGRHYEAVAARLGSDDAADLRQHRAILDALHEEARAEDKERTSREIDARWTPGQAPADLL